MNCNSMISYFQWVWFIVHRLKFIVALLAGNQSCHNEDGQFFFSRIG